jgi:hypothetical protein
MFWKLPPGRQFLRDCRPGGKKSRYGYDDDEDLWILYDD